MDWTGTWRRMRPGVTIVVGLAMAAGALLTLSLMAPGPQVCVRGMATPVAAHARSAPAGRQPGCPAQQSKLGKASQGEP